MSAARRQTDRIIRLKRVYEEPEKDDGVRILVDRLWPRGLAKAKAEIDLWLKDIAPSTALRQWFHRDALRWTEFERRYRDELKEKPDLIATLREHQPGSTLTLLFSARNEEHNNAVVLRDVLLECPPSPRKRKRPV